MIKKRNNFPFNINKSPIFYGWIIVIAGTLGILMSTPGQTIGVSVFTDSLIGVLNLERQTLTFAYFFGTLASGLLIPYVGKLYDRYGSRILAISAAVMLGVFLIYLSKINLIVGIFNNNTTASFILLVLGFYGIRFFGQGILTMVSRNMMMKWFEKRRGLVNSVSGIFVSFGFSAAPKLFNNLIEANNWSIAWFQLALIAIMVFPIIAMFLFRDNPEDCGTVRDGKNIKAAKTNSPKFKPDKQYTKKEAIRTYSFWVFTSVLFLNTMYITAVTFNITSVFSEAGFTNEKAVSIFVPAATIAVLFNLVCGYLSDKVRLKYILILNVAGMLLSSFGVFLLSSSPLAYYGIILGNGISSGTFSILISIVWPRFYGTKNLGKISGFALSWTVYGSAIGPYFFSLSLKYFGSYNIAAITCTLFSLALFFMAFKADNVNEKKDILDRK